MQKRTRITLLTVLCWILIVVLYGYEYVSTSMANPEALNRVPFDPEALALQKTWWIQLLWFTVTRFPFLLAGLLLVLVIERKILLRVEEQ